MSDDKSTSDDRLFVYGSLVDAAERVRLLGRPVDASPARLSGYERGRKRYYFVAPREGAVTAGAILEGMSSRDLEVLDEYEAVPRLYTRERIEVTRADGAVVECWVYLPTAWASED